MKLQPPQVSGSGALEKFELPDLPGTSLRPQAVAKLRELADRLESGELAGARVQWSERVDAIEVVEVRYNATEYTCDYYRQDLATGRRVPLELVSSKAEG